MIRFQRAACSRGGAHEGRSNQQKHAPDQRHGHIAAPAAIDARSTERRQQSPRFWWVSATVPSTAYFSADLRHTGSLSPVLHAPSASLRPPSPALPAPSTRRGEGGRLDSQTLSWSPGFSRSGDCLQAGFQPALIRTRAEHQRSSARPFTRPSGTLSPGGEGGRLGSQAISWSPGFSRSVHRLKAGLQPALIRTRAELRGQAPAPSPALRAPSPRGGEGGRGGFQRLSWNHGFSRSADRLKAGLQLSLIRTALNFEVKRPLPFTRPSGSLSPWGRGGTE
jgi:hypothetical protein